MRCKICQGPTEVAGEKYGNIAKRTFKLRRCRRCQFAFVENPWLDFATIYDVAYYEGRGADPLVDYQYELAHPERTIRRYEWSGIVQVLGHLAALNEKTRWLDYGCGNGGLVRYAQRAIGCTAVGFEQGTIAQHARNAGIPLVAADELHSLQGSFDIVTAVEVLEHVVEPLRELEQVRQLLRPGGVFFYTTGNAQPHQSDILNWSYFTPEIHISLYAPANLQLALQTCGFEARNLGYLPGWDQITAFKVLKNLRIRNAHAWHKWVPWYLLTRALNQRLGLYDFPVAFAG